MAGCSSRPPALARHCPGLHELHGLLVGPQHCDRQNGPELDRHRQGDLPARPSRCGTPRPCPIVPGLGSMVIDSRAGVSFRRRPLSQRRLAASAAHWRLCWRSCFTAAKPTLTSRARSTSWSSTTYNLDASTPSPSSPRCVSLCSTNQHSPPGRSRMGSLCATNSKTSPPSCLATTVGELQPHPPRLFGPSSSPAVVFVLYIPFVQGQSRQPRGGWGVLVHTTAFLPIFLFLKCAIGCGKRSTNTPSSGSLNSLTLGPRPD